jgi:hypothetical protein
MGHALAIVPVSEHDIEPRTEYCKRCGQAVREIYARDLPCVDGDNVVGISHLVRGARLDFLVTDILKYYYPFWWIWTR